jgi:hypothetical protein
LDNLIVSVAEPPRGGGGGTLDPAVPWPPDHRLVPVTATQTGSCGSGLWVPSRAERRPDDAAREVSDLVAKQVAAWHARVLEGFCAPCAEDALFVSPSGLTRGRQAVHDRYVAKYGMGMGWGGS